jgi:peptidoglycan/xylan/chitin deacetylase (PgdA/CDA1 family)
MMQAGKSIASLSLDLDNVWSYMKTHGDEGWQDFPSYLDTLVDPLLQRLRRHGLKLTIFVVGQDAALPKNENALRRLAEGGHNFGNHSFSHEPWFHTYTPDVVEREIRLAEEHIERVTGQRPRGYRGPGFSLTPETLAVLSRRGYRFDASTFPTFLGPIARAYYFFKSSNLSKEEQERRGELFGSAKEGLRDIHPYVWRLPQGDARLLEIPVTTMPLARVPIHLSYLIYLAARSKPLAISYLKAAMMLCKARGVAPSFLLHPLDFLGRDAESRVSFFPGMQLETETKLALFDSVIEEMRRHFELVDLYAHADELLARGDLATKDAA